MLRNISETKIKYPTLVQFGAPTAGIVHIGTFVVGTFVDNASLCR